MSADNSIEWLSNAAGLEFYMMGSDDRKNKAVVSLHTYSGRYLAVMMDFENTFNMFDDAKAARYWCEQQWIRRTPIEQPKPPKTVEYTEWLVEDRANDTTSWVRGDHAGDALTTAYLAKYPLRVVYTNSIASNRWLDNCALFLAEFAVVGLPNKIRRTVTEIVKE